MTSTPAAGATINLTEPAVEQELFLLETLKSLLDGAVRALAGGEAASLLEVSRQIEFTAQQLIALSLQLGRIPWTAEAQQNRRKLLAELAQQRAFCRAMLRRWRRSIALRKQLLALANEPAPYSESLAAKWS